MHTTIELFKTALYNEVKSTLFYKKAAEITKDDESRMLFIEISDMEDDHARNLIKKIESTSFAQQFDAASYMKDLESSLEKTISLKETETLKNGDMKSVLELAIDLEIKALDNYTNLLEKEIDPEVKNICQELANEEREHLNSFKQLLSSIDMDADDRPAL